tara:strand:- start:2936 stop:3457 length:522 start_codon:yes stop_codon:yes gene_type:complete
MSRNFTIIAACDENKGIGKNNSIPWNIPEDLLFFKNHTQGNVNEIYGSNAVIMGRKTFESIGKPLKKRYNCVISKTLNQEDYKDQHVYIYRSLTECLEDLYKKEHIIQVFVIGGAELYKESLSLPQCICVIINNIKGTYDCDSFFPYFDTSNYNLQTCVISPRVTCNIYNKLK